MAFAAELKAICLRDGWRTQTRGVRAFKNIEKLLDMNTNINTYGACPEMRPARQTASRIHLFIFLCRGPQLHVAVEFVFTCSSLSRFTVLRMDLTIEQQT